MHAQASKRKRGCSLVFKWHIALRLVKQGVIVLKLQERSAQARALLARQEQHEADESYHSKQKGADGQTYNFGCRQEAANCVLGGSRVRGAGGLLDCVCTCV